MIWLLSTKRPISSCLVSLQLVRGVNNLCRASLNLLFKGLPLGSRGRLQESRQCLNLSGTRLPWTRAKEPAQVCSGTVKVRTNHPVYPGQLPRAKVHHRPRESRGNTLAKHSMMMRILTGWMLGQSRNLSPFSGHLLGNLRSNNNGHLEERLLSNLRKSSGLVPRPKNRPWSKPRSSWPVGK